MNTSELNKEDSMLLAMIIDDLLREPEGRDEEWIAGMQSPDVMDAAEELFPGWLAKLCQFFAWRDSRKNAGRIHGVLPVAVQRGLLATELHDGVAFYSATAAGREFCVQQYSECGRSMLRDNDRQNRLMLASELCKVLIDRPAGMQRADLMSAAFPPLDWQTASSVGRRAQQESYCAAVPEAFERALSTAIEEDWVTASGNNCRLTVKGRNEGVTRFENWR